jgi:uncharacterized protein (DUF1697 family)
MPLVAANDYRTDALTVQRHVAFLRGINLGKRRVKMDELRRAFESLEHDNVATYIASGNVIFDHQGSNLAALESRIEAHLETVLGFAVDTFVRALPELERITRLDAVAHARAEGFNIHVIFLRRDAGTGVERALGAFEGPDDRFHVRGREVLWLRRGRMTDSLVRDRDLQKAFAGLGNTMRNMNTVEQITAKFGSGHGFRRCNAPCSHTSRCSTCDSGSGRL